LLDQVEAPLSDAPPSLTVTTPDGIALHLVEWRSGGVPCLFLHGLGQHARVWDDVVPFVPREHRPLALDHRGHGRSAWSAERRYGIDTLVADVRHVLAALALDRVVLIGHSLGGSVAMRVAAAAGEAVRGLVVVEAGPELKRRGVRRVIANEHDDTRTYGTQDEYVEALAAKYPFARRDQLVTFARHELVSDGDGFIRRCDPRFEDRTEPCADVDRTRVVTDATLWAGLARTSCPVLIIRGVMSSVLSADAVRRTIEALPDARAVTIPQAGHAVPLENPVALGAAIGEFIATLASVPSRTAAG
jgi:pimeloyl-ACP methyl ester carboxylesterase